MLSLLARIPLRAYLLAAALLAASLALRHALHSADARGYARAQAEYQAAAEAQREANRGSARKAEQGDAVRTVYRDRVITQTLKEIRYETASLSACPVPAGAVRLLNAAAQCAGEDRSPACEPGDPVRPPQ